MPSQKWWFKVNEDINRDEDVWAMTDRFGDRSLRVWLEILSIAHRTAGELPYSRDRMAKSCARSARMTATKCALLLDWMVAESWLIDDGCLRVAKYAKYNNTGEINKSHHGTGSVGLEKKREEENRIEENREKRKDLIAGSKAQENEGEKDAEPSGSIDRRSMDHNSGASLPSYSTAFLRFWSAYPKKVGKADAWRKWKQLKLDSLLHVILAKLEQQQRSAQWQEQGGKFVPNPATYLHQGRWDDSVETYPEGERKKTFTEIFQEREERKKNGDAGRDGGDDGSIDAEFSRVGGEQAGRGEQEWDALALLRDAGKYPWSNTGKGG